MGDQISFVPRERFLGKEAIQRVELILIREQQRMHQNMVGLPTMAPMAGPSL